jgi:BirA family transcriptional regulator, biotin operon repressor / biotin---[acetyl-CoA-carboxylase] ligase
MIIGSKLCFYENLSSTNTQASLLLKESSPPEGTVVYTDYQTKGRGQAGSKWESEKGKNLLISIILYPRTVSPEDQFNISMALSLGLCDFIDLYIQGTTIKWPNDIYVKNDKIAGILIENSVINKTIESTICGIGLNINQESFPGIIPDPVSLKLASGKEFDILICLKQLLSRLDNRYKQLLYDDRDYLRNEYLSRLYRFKKWHSYKIEDTVFTGRIFDVLPSGKLKIENKSGKITEYSFKEVDYVL